MGLFSVFHLVKAIKFRNISLMICLMIVFSMVSMTFKNEKPVQKSLRKSIKINEGWQYLQNSTPDLKVANSSKGWSQVNLPHTWNQWDVLDQIPGYRRDGSWYRKVIQIDDYSSSKYLLHFEASNMTTHVYVNGKLAGSHIGGYVGFHIDISDFIFKGKKNTLTIRVDNSIDRDIIPSQKADFFIYGGIIRDLWLKIIPAEHMDNIKVSTPVVNKNSAQTKVELKLKNLHHQEKAYQIKYSLVEKVSKKIIVESEQVISGSQAVSVSVLPDVIAPLLWSPDAPNLYILNIKLFKKGKLIDEVDETIGYRWYHFDDHGPFYLNGERLLLRGTHLHEDHAGFGAAMTDELRRKDVEMIKEMGANFLRLAHYPQDPEVYKACDELGLIVWDELPWCRGGMGEEVWQKNTKRLLEEQINQNFNHPSILFWALGNEVYWLPDFKGGDNQSNLNAYLTGLNKTAHAIDPGRMTAIRKYYEGADLVDVFSPSIWSGWYAGTYSNYESTLTKNQTLYKRFLHMEYGGTSHIGRHTENPITGEGMLSDKDWAEVSNQVNIANIAQSGDNSENYMVDLFDWYLHISENQKGFAGNAQWAFKDFGTPLRPEDPIPYMNQKGLVDREGRPKDAFYVFKSYWAKKPFAYIESHTWTERSGQEGKPKEISVYSNCIEVEFYVNGKSLGRKVKNKEIFPAGGLNWSVSFREGENEMIAIGYNNGIEVTKDNLNINYSFKKPGTADQIKLSKTILPNGNYLIVAEAIDKNGIRATNYEKRIYFSHDGPGVLMSDYGVPDKSRIIEMANGRAEILFIPGNGTTIIEARNQDFKGSYLTIESREMKKVK